MGEYAICIIDFWDGCPCFIGWIFGFVGGWFVGFGWTVWRVGMNGGWMDRRGIDKHV